MGQVHFQDGGPGSRDSPLVRRLFRFRSGRHGTGVSFLQVQGGTDPYGAGGDPFLIGLPGNPFQAQAAFGGEGCRDVVLFQVGDIVQVEGLSGHDAGGFRPGELEETGGGDRVFRSGKDDLDRLEQVSPDVEVGSHVAGPQIDGVSQILVFAAAPPDFDGQVDIGAVADRFKAEVLVHRLPAFRAFLDALAVLQHVQGDGMPVPALLDFVQVHLGGAVVFHQLGRIVLAEILDEVRHFGIGILHDHVHGLHMPSFRLHPGQVEPDVELRIQLLHMDGQSLSGAGQTDTLFDTGHGHAGSGGLQAFEFGRPRTGEPERFQFACLQAGTHVGGQVQVTVVDDGVNVHLRVDWEEPTEAFLRGFHGNGTPFVQSRIRPIGKQGPGAGVESEQGRFLEVFDFDGYDGPGPGILHPFIQGDGHFPVQGLVHRLFGQDLPAGRGTDDGSSDNRNQCLDIHNSIVDYRKYQ